MFVVQQKTLRLFFEKDVRIRNVQAVWKFPAFCAKRDLKKSVRIKDYPKLPKRVFFRNFRISRSSNENFRYFWRNKQTLTAEFVLSTFHENLPLRPSLYRLGYLGQPSPRVNFIERLSMKTVSPQGDSKLKLHDYS